MGAPILWVFDLDGVVWLAGRAIPGSPEAIESLRRAGHRVVFVTNNSAPTRADYAERLSRAGVPAAPEELVTSAQAAASMVEPGQRVAYIGGAGVEEALTDRGVEVVAMAQRPDAVVVGRSLRLDFAELADAASAIRQGARFVATNTDATFPTPEGLEPGAGALVAYLEVGSGRRAEVAGKPHRPMAELLRDRFGVPTAVVGDRPDTDGAFAERVGSAFALVLSGVTTRRDLPISPPPALVADDLAAVAAAWPAGPPGGWHPAAGEGRLGEGRLGHGR